MMDNSNVWLKISNKTSIHYESMNVIRNRDTSTSADVTDPQFHISIEEVLDSADKDADTDMTTNANESYTLTTEALEILDDDEDTSTMEIVSTTLT